MKKQIRNRALAIVLGTAMLLSVGSTAFAADKANETVYVLLNANGEAHDIIVKSNNSEQKDVKGELPFKIKIAYTLDEKGTAPQEMIGKSGKVKIKIDVAPNANAKDYFKNNLALQMQMPIDTGEDLATDISAPGLTGVTVGSVKTFSGIVLPGKKASFEISYKTSAFQLQSINFVCMPFDASGMIDIDISDMEGQITKLQDGINQYVDGVSAASAGIDRASNGIGTLSNNSQKLIGGVSQTNGGSKKLMYAMLATMPPQMQAMFEPQINAILAGQQQTIDSLCAYANGVDQSAKGMKELSAGAAQLATSGNTLKDGVNSAVAPLSGMPKFEKSDEKAVSFVSADEIAEIQFVMKTDALEIDKSKDDVVPAEKPKESFWQRLLNLFGL